MSRMTSIVLTVLFVSLALPVLADTIVYRGREYSEVVIEELVNQYVVHFPDTGRKKYISKEEVSSVEISGTDRRARRTGSLPAVVPRERATIEPVAEATELSEQQAALQQYKARRRIKAQAEFEAAFEHWAQLTDEQRTALHEYAEAQADAAEAQMQQVAGSVGQVRQQIDAEQEAIRANIESIANERDRRIDENYGAVYEEPDVETYAEPYPEPYFYLNEHVAEQAEALDYIAEVTYEDLPYDVAEEFADDYWGWSEYQFGYEERWMEDALAEADEEAFWLEEEYNAQIEEENRAFQRFAQERRRIERRNNAVLQRAVGYANQTAAVANHLRILEDARNREYTPSLQYTRLFSVEGRGIVQRTVSTASTILRVDWWVDVSNPLANQLTIRVFDAISDRPVKTDTSAKLASEHFFLIDRPGDYVIEAEAPEGLTYTLEASELRDFAFVAIAKEE